MKFFKYTREILITGLIIFVIILFIKPCGRERVLNENRELVRQKDSVIRENHALINRSNQRHAADSLRLITAHAQSVAAQADAQAAKNKVIAGQQTINRLIAKINNSPEIPDSSFVLVHPNYVEGCDSLANVVSNQQQQISDYMGEIDQATELLNYEVILRDSVIEDSRNEFNKLQAQFVALQTVAKNALNQGKPRGSLWGGISILGNEKQWISGAGAIIAYQTKGGKQYQLSPKFVKFPTLPNAELFIEGGVLFKF